MVAHNDIRKKKPELWKNNQLMVVDKIRKVWGMTQYNEEEIHTICGILEVKILIFTNLINNTNLIKISNFFFQVNAFEVGQMGASIRALYPRAYLLAHDCTPNTTHTDDAKRRITIRAATKIRKGEAITLSYAYTLQVNENNYINIQKNQYLTRSFQSQSTHKRREHLLESKFFECCCLRCKDPTEFGTFTCALKCPRCGMAANKDVVLQALFNKDENLKKIEIKSSPGTVLPTDPLDPDAPWRCDTCPSYSITASSAKTLIQRYFLFQLMSNL